MADATDADLEYLSSLPVAKVIDFRKDEEKKGKDDREYGSMDVYLKGPIGLTDQDILTLRERYLTK